MTKIRRVMAAVVLVVTGAVAHAVVTDESEPSCPTEDSCVVDYRDGGWHIEEVTP